MHDIIIGIDPDSSKDGVAILETKTRKVTIYETNFGHTLALLQKYHTHCLTTHTSLMIYIEGGWLNKGNFHLHPRSSLQKAAAIGVDQGRNHQRGMDIENWCEYNKLPYLVIKPLAKTSGRFHLWNGPDGKITQEEIESFMGKLRTTDALGHIKRINQEGRDAALIAWTMAGFPISVQFGKK